MRNLSRRSIMGGAAALPFLAAPVLATNPDTSLLAMWERRKALLRQWYEADDVEDGSPLNRELTSLLDAIRAAKPVTPAGAAAKLSQLLIDVSEAGEVERALIYGKDPEPVIDDFRHLAMWHTIVALRAMGAAHG